MTNIRRGMMGAAGGAGGYTLWSWGFNGEGQLGLGDVANRSVPVQIGTDTDWLQIASGGPSEDGSSFGIKTDYTLWAWGKGKRGVLGLGDVLDRSSPTQVGSLSNWLYIHVGQWNTAAVKTDGTLWTWGEAGADTGYLGRDSTTDTSSPVQVESDTDWRIAFQSRSNGMGIRTDGTLWGWGGYAKLLGSGTTLAPNPIQIGSDTDWANVIIGDNSSMAVKTTGTLWATGCHDSGRTALNTTTSAASTHQQVGSLTDWPVATAFYTKFASGEGRGFAIKQDGKLWSWGKNTRGVLGHNTVTNTSSPVQFGAESTWAKVHCHAQSDIVFAINDAAELWFAGNGHEGCAGINLASGYRSSPTQVGSDTDWYSVRSGPKSILAIRSA